MSHELPETPAEEPALTVGTITAVSAAVLSALVAFGLDISDTKVKAILAIVGILAPLVAAWFTRRRVFSPATVERLLNRSGQ
jgi:hypothetical protein